MGTFLKEHRLGEVLFARFDVVLSPIDVVEPDLLYVSNERSNIFTEDNAQGMPDLLVEIVSDTTRRMDEIVKLQLYERFGVREYWIVDPVLDAVKVYRWVDLVFTKVAELSAAAGDLLTTPLLPGLEIPLPSDLRVTAAEGWLPTRTISPLVFRLTKWRWPGRRLALAGEEGGLLRAAKVRGSQGRYPWHAPLIAA